MLIVTAALGAEIFLVVLVILRRLRPSRNPPDVMSQRTVLLLNLSLFLVLTTVIFLGCLLAGWGSITLGMTIFASTLAAWAAIDPRIDWFPLSFLVSFARKTLTKNPLSALLFLGWFVIFIGGIGSIGAFLVGTYNESALVARASAIALSGILLVALSVLLSETLRLKSR
jgi:hypothetical protein